MFCSNCGKNIADDSKFCDGCGAPVSAAAQPAAPVASAPARPVNPIFTNFIGAIKGFFSNNTVKTVGNAAKSNGLEWLLFFGINLLVYALALPLNIMGMLDSLISGASSYLFDFGIWLLYGIVLSAGSYFLMATAMFIAVKFVFKKNVTYFAALNMVAVASIPLTCVYVLNIIFGFIFTPAVFVFSAIGLIATFILLYAGMQKFDKLDNSPYWAYVIICAAVVIVIGLLGYLFVDLSVSSLFGGITNSFGRYF